MKFVHYFFVANWVCQASTDSTEKLTIVPADATIVSTIIIVYNWSILSIKSSYYKLFLDFIKNIGLDLPSL